MLFGIRLCSFSTHESGEHPTTTPSRGGGLCLCRGHQLGVLGGAAPPTREWATRQSNHRRLATAHDGKGEGRMGDCDCASVFSDNKSLSRQWLLIWTRMENQSIQSSFVCLVISFWTMFSPPPTPLPIFCFRCVFALNISAFVGLVWLEKTQTCRKKLRKTRTVVFTNKIQLKV